MLTVQYFVSHFRKTLCKKKKMKHLFICYLNQIVVMIDSKLSFFYRNGSHKVLFVTLQYIKHLFCSIL